MKEQWHALGREKVLEMLGSRRSGLSWDEAREQYIRYGPNELTGKKEPSRILVFLRQFASPLIYILVAAALVSAVIGHFLDAGVIMGVLILNAVIGYTQETRAEKAMKALLEMAAPKASVRRDNIVESLSAKEIVPGDILLFEAGDKVPADARLIEVFNLKVDESALTGESVPVDKGTGTLETETPVAERQNVVYLGTIVTYGRATAVVTATGMSTELGGIAASLQEVGTEETPLQKSLSQFGRFIMYFFMGIVVMLAIAGIIKGLKLIDMFLLAVAAAVSAIPEGLPAVMTIVLAIGMRMMAERHAVIRKLVAVETLGSATTICSDKTGTLTLNQMTVREIYVNNEFLRVTGEGYVPQGQFYRDDRVIETDGVPNLAQLLRIGALCNDATVIRINSNYRIFGDPTEAALVVAAAKAGMEKASLEEELPRIDEIPFQSEKQFMATLHWDGNTMVAFVKGATEKLLSMSRYYLKDGMVVPLTDKEVDDITTANVAMAGDAMRVIATAYVTLPPDKEDLTDDDISGRLVFVGMSGMADPPREEVRKAIRECQDAGIRTMMITGDHKITAESIAHQLGLPPGRTITGTELKTMSDEELFRAVKEISIYARIEPLQKLRIVNALKEHGEVVAMTGDGVNDAPALKSANIGIAMGITGTDVAKEASDMVLADDNFASIVAAVEEGRAIFNRLRNVIFYLISTNLGELITLILSIFILGVTPLIPVQLLWVNLVTDTAGALPLSLEPKFGDELKQPPRHPKVGLIYPGLVFRIGFVSVLMGIGTYLVFLWELQHTSLAEARTIAFCTMVTYQWFAAFYARSDELTNFKLGIFRNLWLVVFIFVAILLQLAVIYIPFLRPAFGTVPIGLDRWGLVVATAGSLFVIEEIRKMLFPGLFRRGKWQP
ncbi:MAG: HAD-IC family P-type ATPase [Chloroflexota bacterium]